ncbi:MAG: hypothetical protein D6713_00230 [Deltaproteobacteria bacterium]|nr:MAG: hypothetical protein D6713_00230 [Deltaproteobacteria bacterium]
MRGRKVSIAISVLLVFLVSILSPSPSPGKTTKKKLEAEKARLIRLKKEQEKARRELLKTIRKQKRLKKNVSSLLRQLKAKERFLRRIERELKYVETLLERYSTRAQDLEEKEKRLREISRLLTESYLNLSCRPRLALLSPARDEREKYILASLFQKALLVGEKLERENDYLSRKLRKLRETREYWESKEKDTLSRRKRLAAIQKKRERELRTLEERRRSIEKKYARLKKNIESLQKIVEEIEKKARVKRRKGLSGKVTGSFAAPASGRVVARFGRVKDRDFNVYIENKGVEIKGKPGGAVRAVRDGKVVYQGTVSGFGLVTVIEHPGEIFSVYGKVAVYNVRVGDRVKKGEKIGNLSRNSPYLYFELRVRGKPVNPLKYIRIPRG